MDTVFFDDKIFHKAFERAKKVIGSGASHSEVIVFLEREIDGYREKISCMEKHISLLNKITEMQREPAKVETMPTFELLPKTAAGEIIKALADNGFDTITINAYKSKEG